MTKHWWPGSALALLAATSPMVHAGCGTTFWPKFWMRGLHRIERTRSGWLYVAAVIDLYSRRLVCWSMSPTMTAQLVTDAQITAIWCRGKFDSLLHHSDQGSQ
jgi:transposase InsO family protein